MNENVANKFDPFAILDEARLQRQINSITGGGGSALTITDGTTTIEDVAQIVIIGGTVSGSSPDATLTVTGLFTGAGGGSGNTAGTDASSFGLTNTASGAGSVAAGHNSVASSSLSIAMGDTDTASGYAAVSMGYNNTASGFYSITLGSNNQAENGSDVAVGDSSTASGGNSFAANGSTASGNIAAAFCGGTASGSQSFAGCAGTASGTQSYAFGAESIADGRASKSFGTDSWTKGISFAEVFGADNNFVIGRAGQFQRGSYVMSLVTADATPTAITTDGNPPSAINQIAMVNGANSALGASYSFSGQCVAVDIATGNSTTWTFSGSIKQATTAASTSLAPVAATNPNGATGIAITAQDTGMVSSGIALAISADVANGALQITATGIAATTIRWVGNVETAEVTY